MAKNLSTIGPDGLHMEFILGKNTVNLWPVYVKKMVVLDRITSGITVAYFRFFDDKWEMLEKLFLQSKEEFKFRYGYSDGRMTKWKRMVIANYKQTYTTGGSTLDLTLSDFSILGNRDISRSFGSVPISDIVKQIAEENGWPYVIEETRNSYSFRQNNISDCDFIKNWLLPRSVSQLTGRSDYRFYFKDGWELHFHTPDFEKVVYKTYKVFDEGEHPINSFTYKVNMDRYFGDMSNAPAIVAGYDPLNKTELKVSLDNNSTAEKVKMGLNLPRLTRTGTGGSFNNVAVDERTKVEDLAKQLWYENDYNLVNAYLNMSVDPALVAGRLIDIYLSNRYVNGPANGSGKYLVNDIITYFSIKPLQFVSHLFLGRNALSIGEVTVSGEVPKATHLKYQITGKDDSTVGTFANESNSVTGGRSIVKEILPVG